MNPPFGLTSSVTVHRAETWHRHLPPQPRPRLMIEPLGERAIDAEAPPVSALGQRLAAIRQRAIERGMVLKSADEILAEVHEGRAEAADDQDLR